MCDAEPRPAWPWTIFGLVRFQVGDELLEVLRREILLGDDRHRRLREHADVFEIGDRVVAQVRIERAVSGMAEVHDEQVVAVARRGGRHLLRADRAAGAADVLDQELLAQRLGHAGADDAGDGVAGPARGVGHHDGHGLGRKVLLRQRAGDGGEAQRGGGECSDHGVPSLDYLWGHFMPSGGAGQRVGNAGLSRSTGGIVNRDGHAAAADIVGAGEGDAGALRSARSPARRAWRNRIRQA